MNYAYGQDKFGQDKFGQAELLASSTGRGWSDVSAELRYHSAGAIAWHSDIGDTRMCVSIDGSSSIVTRRGEDIFDQAVATRGAIWLAPARLGGTIVDLSDPVPEILHMQFSHLLFAQQGCDTGVDGVAQSLRYETSFEDPLMAEIAYAIAAELKSETSAGAMLVATLASTLAARVIQRNQAASPLAQSFRTTTPALDHRRLSRVLDHIEDNLEGDLSIDGLAAAACLSPFHFARAFKATVGSPPHRYVSTRRLARAKVLLAGDKQSLVDIALTLGFSCQANFNRAFRQATGRTPGQYRRGQAMQREG